MLQELKRFEVKGQAEAFALRQIGQLEELKGSLCIYNLENAQTGEEANLLNKRHLHKLVLVWSDDSSQAEHVLENLKPHSNLAHHGWVLTCLPKTCKLFVWIAYSGTNFPL